MAIYVCNAKVHGRAAKDKTGKAIPGKQVSIVAKAAYRSGEKLRDDKQEKTFNYRSRAQEVVHAEIIVPKGSPEWMAVDRGRLWNAIEVAEKRKDSQLAREFIIALPVELDTKQQIELVRSWCDAEIVNQGFVADFAIHRSKNGRNPHAHVLHTLRPVEGNGFGKKPDMTGKFHGRGAVGKGAKGELEGWRASWETHCNAALEKAGRHERIDHRSLKDQGIDRLPQPKIGVAAMAMERKGIATERAKLVRWSKMDNLLITTRRALRFSGNTSRSGIGATWWERAQVVMRSGRDQMSELLRDESSGGRLPSAVNSWTQYVANRRIAQPERPTERDSSLERG